MYFKFLGEKPFIAGNAARRSALRRSMTWVAVGPGSYDGDDRKPPLHRASPPVSSAVMAGKRSPEIARYIVERRAVLLNEDIEVMRAHLVKYGNERARTAAVETLRIAWHKARTAALEVPLVERQLSVDWLDAPGFQHFADELRPSKLNGGRDDGA